MRATVTIEDLPDGEQVIIEYEDGHQVLMRVGLDSPVLRMHLALGNEPGGDRA
jgi:hypothetical protein